MRNYWNNKESKYKDDAIALIEGVKKDRRQAVERIVELRRLLREAGTSQKNINSLCRMASKDVGKLSIPHLEKERQRNLEFGGHNFGPIILDDGYACCGMEDARDEQQHYAREHAKVLRVAIFALKKEACKQQTT